MSRAFSSWLLAIAALTSCLIGSTALAAGQRWAVLIGVNDYSNLEDLRYCSQDVKSLRDRLISSGFDEERVTAVHSSAEDSKLFPSKANIERQLELILGFAEPGDVVIVAFSGHGMLVEGRSYLCPADAHPDRVDTLVPLGDVYAKLDACRASLKLLVADACRNDPRPPGRRSASTKQDVRQLAQALQTPPTGIVVLSSCTAGEVSMESEDFGHGVFMHYLLEGLAGEAETDGKEGVSLYEAATYTAEKTKLYVYRNFNESQRPELNKATVEALGFPLTFPVAATVIATLPQRPAPQPDEMRTEDEGEAATDDLFGDTSSPRTGSGPRVGSWPQWHGPDRNNVSSETGLVKSWSEEAPPRRWLFKNCGIGLSGPAIEDGLLYTLGGRDGSEWLIAVNTDDGEEAWAAKVGEIYEDSLGGDGPRSTPIVDGDFVYGLGAQGNLICARTDSGKIVWSISMSDLGGETPPWGYANSPLLYQGKIICVPGGSKGAVAALDKSTGDTIWQSSDVTDQASHSSPTVMSHDGHDELIQLLPNQLVGLDPESGALLWSEDWPKPAVTIPTPAVHGDLLYVVSGYGIGSKLYKIGANHAVEMQHESKAMKNRLGGYVIVDGYVYGHSDQVGWVCQDFASGEQQWREREALAAGALTYADGMLYCLSEGGEVALVEASPHGWAEHGRFTLDPRTDKPNKRETVWTHPVICGGRLYIRDQTYLHCFDISEPEAGDE